MHNAIGNCAHIHSVEPFEQPLVGPAAANWREDTGRGDQLWLGRKGIAHGLERALLQQCVCINSQHQIAIDQPDRGIQRARLAAVRQAQPAQAGNTGEGALIWPIAGCSRP